VMGKRIGRDIGFPTANLDISEPYKLIPAYGIYAVEVAEVHPETAVSGDYVQETETSSYKGMGYIGTRPTINGVTRSIEVNIFYFNASIYGKTLRVRFLHFISHDNRFNNLHEMQAQIAIDKRNAKKLLE